MNSIPVLGTAIVNGFHWLSKQVASIDFPIDNYLVINNSGDDKMSSQLNKLSELEHPYIKNFKVINLPSNIGCGGAWNLIIKSYIMSPGWLITSNDVSFTPGLLKELASEASREDIGMVFGKGGDYGLGSYDLFYIKDWVVNAVGLFDENLYPAYCEDWDYILRLQMTPVKTVYDLKAKYYHGDTFDYHESGKQTKRLDPELSNKIDKAWNKNREYMRNKWGDEWEQFKPKPQAVKPFDLVFRKNKYLGF